MREERQIRGSLQLREQRSLFEEADQPLQLSEYQSFTRLTDHQPVQRRREIGLPLLGLFGEIGSLLSALKKKQRDSDAYTAYRDEVIEELGDALWYFVNICDRVGLNVADLAARIPARLATWESSGHSHPSSFVALQRNNVQAIGPLAAEEVEKGLLALAGYAGKLMEDYSSGRISANRDVVSADLIEILRALVTAAEDSAVSLDEAAEHNIDKVLSRWPITKAWGALYDEGLDPDEQLPRLIAMTFRERDVAGKKYVTQQCRGINIGDRLTDNRIEHDDYRFHDVFHLAYAAILGWSPVLRALFKVKRKSDPQIDEAQDGARAIIIEEGVATWIFGHALRQHDFRSVTTLDYPLLKAVADLVKGYEVESRPLWQWEYAIIEGFRIFRELRHHRSGIVTANLLERSISFETLH